MGFVQFPDQGSRQSARTALPYRRKPTDLLHAAPRGASQRRFHVQLSACRLTPLPRVTETQMTSATRNYQCETPPGPPNDAGAQPQAAGTYRSSGRSPTRRLSAAAQCWAAPAYPAKLTNVVDASSAAFMSATAPSAFSLE